MNATKLSRHPSARKTREPLPSEVATDDRPIDPRSVLDYVHLDLARVAMLAQAACEALAGLPYVADPADRKRLRRLDALVTATAAIATGALVDADVGIEALDAER